MNVQATLQVYYYISSSHSQLSNMHSVHSLLPPPTALRVVAIDLPGHGRSSHRPPGAFYHIQNYIADVKYVIDGEWRYIAICVAQAFIQLFYLLLLALKWKKFSFLAHSMGESLASIHCCTVYMLTASSHRM